MRPQINTQVYIILSCTAAPGGSAFLIKNRLNPKFTELDVFFRFFSVLIHVGTYYVCVFGFNGYTLPPSPSSIIHETKIICIL